MSYQPSPMTPAQPNEAIENALSIRAIPTSVLSPFESAYQELIRRAIHGEECHAYQPNGAHPDQWNLWIRDAEHPGGWRCSPSEWRAYWTARIASGHASAATEASA